MEIRVGRVVELQLNFEIELASCKQPQLPAVCGVERGSTAGLQENSRLSFHDGIQSFRYKDIRNNKTNFSQTDPTSPTLHTDSGREVIYPSVSRSVFEATINS